MVIVSQIIIDTLNLRTYIDDTGGLSIFITSFGTIYGIIVGFIVIEVWTQKNNIQKLLEKEAKDIEGLYFLVHYFNDTELEKKLKKRLLKYVNVILKLRFDDMSATVRNQKIDKIFMNISRLFDGIKFDEEQDPIIFEQMLNQFKELKDTRTERIRESLIRLPTPIQLFILLGSFVMVLAMIVTPFSNQLLAVCSVLSLTFFVVFVQQIINDLDNPFVGYWNVDFEPLHDVKNKLMGKKREAK